MDVQLSAGPGGSASETLSAGRPPSRQRVGELLGLWQAQELRSAWRFPQCRGLSRAELEDLYQETVLALLQRTFYNEEHLRNALRLGLKHRALHVHRDARRHLQILSARAGEEPGAARTPPEHAHPEHAALAHEDGLVVLEFASELTRIEQRVWGLEAEGMRYRAIAPLIGLSVNETRRVTRSLARKRERFQLLHDTGRLCGYRAPAIRALLAGEATSEQLEAGAYAHLEGCAHCRAEHKTNAKRLRRSFHERAAALLPLPLANGHLPLLWHLHLRLRVLSARCLSWGPTSAGGGVRERAIAMAAGSGVAAKLAAGAATVAVIAGGTLGVAARPSRPARPRRQAAAAGRDYRAQATSAGTRAQLVVHAGSARAAPLGAPVSSRQTRQHEPGGFAFLGVPAAPRGGRARAPLVAREASVTPRHEVREADAERGGGAFSP